MIKVAIVDDQGLMRDGLKTILSTYSDIEVVALGKDGHDAIDICRKYDVDIILMDIRMPNMSGVEAVKELKRLNTNVKIIMLTTFDDEAYIIEAIGNGASGYLFKDIEYDKLVNNIKDVYNGNYVMPTKVANVLAMKIINQEKRKEERKIYNLTTRELEIAEMIKDGFNNSQIARNLYISDGTCKNYISSIYSKTGVNNREELICLLKEII